MKKVFISVLLFFLCFGTKAQTPNSDVFDFDVTDTFYYYWGTYLAMNLDSRLIIDTVSYKHNQWQIGKPNKKIFDSAYTLPNAIVTDTLLPCLPNDTSVFFLKLPYSGWPYSWALDYLSFDYKLDIDSGDIALVEASVDSGQTWTNILVDTSIYWRTYPTPNLSVSTTQWDSVTIYTSPWPVLNDTIYVRFTFITSNDTTAREGWMIDHIVAQHFTEAVADLKDDNTFRLYPNPANGEVKVELTNTLNNGYRLTVLNAVGMCMLTDKIPKGNTSYMMQVRDWNKGVYFIELDDGKGSRAVKKLVVE